MSAEDDDAGLAAAHALGALDDDERLAVEERLERDPVLAARVEGFRAALGAWGGAAPVPPPPALRRAVMAALDDVAQLPRDGGATASVTALPRRAAAPSPARASRRGRSRPVLAVLATAAAAAVVAAAGLGGWQVLRGGGAGTDVASAADRLEGAPDAVVVPASAGSDGAWAAARLVYSEDEHGAVLSSSEPIPAPDRGVYVVWRMEGARAEPAGSFHDGDGAVLDGAPGAAGAVAVTVEPDAGADAPTTEPVAVFAL